MKHLLLIIAASVVFAFGSMAQTAADSKGISFQGIARDNTGSVFASKTINVTFTIQNGTTTVYQETQSGLSTDVAGVFSTYIGSGSATVATGNKYSAFSDVDFSVQYNIQVAVAINGGSLVTIGTYALQAVPYSKFATLAATATNAIHAVKADSAVGAVSATNGVPPGSMMAFAGPKTNIPAGWLYCDGTAYSRTGKYAALFAAIGTSWGYGDNTTSFNVPNTKGEFLRGVNDGSGTDPDASARTFNSKGGNTGDNVGSSQTDDLKAHNHAYSKFYLKRTNWSDGGSSSTDGTGYNTSTTTGSVGGNETRPENVGVFYIIKY